MKKVLWFDTETTGLDPVKQDIIQLAGMIEFDGEIVTEFNLKMHPFDFTSITDEAVETHGVTRVEMAAYPPPKEVHEQLLKILGAYVSKFDKGDKLYMGGYNVGFDVEFLAQHFVKCDDKYMGSWVNWRKIDPMMMAHWLDYRGELNLPDYKLATVCKFLGISLQAHDALADIRATVEVYKILNGMFNKEEAF